jgi:DNA modification methylase
MQNSHRLVAGCCLQQMSAIRNESVNLTVTSPPYFQQKDYGNDLQIGWEDSLDAYLAKMRKVLEGLYRLTAVSGSAFVVVGDSYVRGTMQLVPQRLACMAAECGWFIRNDLIWFKTDAAPGRGPNRWRMTHEHILFLVKSRSGYIFNEKAIRKPYSEATLRRWGKGQQYGGPKARTLPMVSDKKEKAKGNRFPVGRSFRLNPDGTMPSDVIQCPSGRSSLDHYATFPPSLIETFVLAASNKGDLVFDPFAGTCTTGEVALRHGRKFYGIELSDHYVSIGRKRLATVERSDARISGVSG